jgi:16S rRNA (guanine(1405)-N(7))-methyltransferase
MAGAAKLNNDNIEKINQLLGDVFDKEVADICKRYQIDHESARQTLKETAANHPAFFKKLTTSTDPQTVTRWREFKEIIKQTRSTIYNNLRQYHADKPTEIQLIESLESNTDPQQRQSAAEDLLKLHASTRERTPDKTEFYNQILAFNHSATSILDLGCGYQPLAFPFNNTALNIQIYTAVDDDELVHRAVSALAKHPIRNQHFATHPTRLIPIRADLTNPNWPAALTLTLQSYDIALMLKLIPVLMRHNKNRPPDSLLNIPAKNCLITASRNALAKKQRIDRREDAALKNYANATNREILERFETGNEFGYWLSEPKP